MNLAQWFMALQVVTCLLGAFGFWWNGQPWHGSVWLFYSAANVGWFYAAGGKA